nr:D245 [uncultured bacterium]
MRFYPATLGVDGHAASNGRLMGEARITGDAGHKVSAT